MWVTGSDGPICVLVIVGYGVIAIIEANIEGRFIFVSEKNREKKWYWNKQYILPQSGRHTEFGKQSSPFTGLIVSHIWLKWLTMNEARSVWREPT